MKKKLDPRKRISVLLILCFIGICVVVGRLFWLQFLNPEYKQKMLELTRKTVDLYPERGQIYDRDGYVFAYNEKGYVLYLFPTEIEDKAMVSKQLQEILNIDATDVDAWFSEESMVTVDREITAEQGEQLLAIESGGISVITQNRRRYPDGQLSGAVVGFTNQEQVGTIGIESYYDNELKGVQGKTQLYAYSGGIPVPYEQQELYPAKKGNSIHLTLDAKIQQIILEEGMKAYEDMTPKKMSVIAMNPNNGQILGMMDFPALDAAHPLMGRTEDEEHALNTADDATRLDMQYQMWRSFSFQDVYEPGSVFKVITAAAAFEEGTASEDTVYHCDGYVTDIPGVTIRCWRHYDPHGDLTFVEAMDESCNVAFVQMIRDLGKEKARAYMDAFGFGKITNVGLPSEAEGIMPENPELINEATFATNSYGHGVATTPLQMLNAICATVNGGTLYQPQIVKAIESDGQTQEIAPKPLRRVISEETSGEVRYLLQHGVEHGTADGGAIPGYKIGGKTGTSVKFVDGEYSQDVIVGSFVGVYPADNPEIAILVVMDEPNAYPSGNTTAAPLAQKIIKAYIDQKGDEPTEEIIEDVDNPTLIDATFPAEGEEPIITDDEHDHEHHEEHYDDNSDATDESNEELTIDEEE